MGSLFSLLYNFYLLANEKISYGVITHISLRTFVQNSGLPHLRLASNDTHLLIISTNAVCITNFTSRETINLGAFTRLTAKH